MNHPRRANQHWFDNCPGFVNREGEIAHDPNPEP